MLDTYQYHEFISYLKIIADTLNQTRDPVNFTIQISSQIPWSIDYKNRKHLFVWSPSNMELSIEDYGNFSLPFANWVPFDFPAGSKVYNTSSATLSELFFIATDENMSIFSEHVDTDLTPLLVSAGSNLTSVASSTSQTTILASNPNRKAIYVYNDSSAVMYISLDSTASTTHYTTQIPANSFYEVPTTPLYIGTVTAVWSSATGNARVTEIV